MKLSFFAHHPPAALAAKLHGEDWFHHEPESGVSLQIAVHRLTLHTTGAKQHEEFVNSQIKLDA